MIPLAVDPTINAAYVFEPLEGRCALYRIALDGTLKTELVFRRATWTSTNVVRVGRAGRVIGATYTTDRRQRGIFRSRLQSHPRDARARAAEAAVDRLRERQRRRTDPAGLRPAAISTPGHWYVYDRAKKALVEAITSRPGLKGKSCRASTGHVSRRRRHADSGLPDAAAGRHRSEELPAIVMPHGGPASRDEWGFDWLSQFFAQRGFVVLQPNYRGSAGYGAHGSRTTDSEAGRLRSAMFAMRGRWLISQGMADPSKLAVFGWSYGGYAALQANVSMRISSRRWSRSRP